MELLEKHSHTVKNCGTAQKHSTTTLYKCVKSFERCRNMAYAPCFNFFQKFSDKKPKKFSDKKIKSFPTKIKKISKNYCKVEKSVIYYDMVEV